MEGNIHILMVIIILLYTSRLCHSVSAWTTWGPWSSCSKTCGIGVKDRTRSCSPASDPPCPGDSEDHHMCNLHDCPLDGVWQPWMGWGACSVTCGGGLRRRERECDNPAPGGAPCQGDNFEEEPCSSNACPVDGTWSVWSAWSGCPVTCGGGEDLRTRICVYSDPQNKGASCPGDNNDVRQCNSFACPLNEPVDGQWTVWSLIGECSVECGEGIAIRRRTCTNPTPANGGLPCNGSSEEQSKCYQPSCPIHGEWGPWSPFTPCSQTCQGGLRTRKRLCDSPPPQYNGNDCVAYATDWKYNTGNSNNVTQLSANEELHSQSCNENLPCPVIDGAWGSWVAISDCSQTCGTGRQTRIRFCNSPAPTNGGRLCALHDDDDDMAMTKDITCNPNPCPIHGVWAEWSEYSSCSVECGSGKQSRNRSCTNPPPAYGGTTCSGLDSQEITCVKAHCSVDGGWSEWSEFNDCSVTCGGGSQTRTRSCDNPPPAGEGATCEGNSTEPRACANVTCPPIDGHWGQWSEFTKCTETCGKGLTFRVRRCDNPEPEAGGQDCQGNNIHSEECNLQTCHIEVEDVDGKWADWSTWSGCSKTCGTGVSKRQRTCSDPAPSGDGSSCDSTSDDLCISRETMIDHCNENPCPVDGQWSDWTAWSMCSKSCLGGLKFRIKLCDNPKPANGGQLCYGATPFNIAQAQTTSCNTLRCEDVVITMPKSSTTVGSIRTTTPATGSSLPPARPSCKEETDEIGFEWPSTDVGETVTVSCPPPNSGVMHRKCNHDQQWESADTSRCITETYSLILLYSYQAGYNATARAITIEQIEAYCMGKFTLSGPLITCKHALMVLILMDLPGNPTITDAEILTLIESILKAVDSLLDKKNLHAWVAVLAEEEVDGTSVIGEFLHAMESFANFVAEFLKVTGRSRLCTTKTNIDFCVEQLNCATRNYRYPKEPPPPTDPPKHVRGGVEAAAPAKLSFVSIPDALVKEATCNVDGEADDTIPPVYAVTVKFEHVDKFLPDENKEAVDLNAEVITASPLPDVPRQVNSHILVSTLYGSSLDLNNLDHPVTLTFYFDQGGRESKCMYLDPLDRRRLYKYDGCKNVSETRNLTKCECSHMSAFGVLMMPGAYPEGPQVGSPDPLVSFACSIGIIAHAIVIIAYVMGRIYKGDFQFIMINFCAAVILGEFMMASGGWATHVFRACRFIAFVIFASMLASVFWLLCHAAYLYRTVRLQTYKPLGLYRRLVYAGVGWGVAVFITVITIGLGHNEMVQDYGDFCWLVKERAILSSFALPFLIVCVMVGLVWVMTYRVTVGMYDEDNMTEEEEDDYYDKITAQKKLIGLLVLVFLNWLMFSLLLIPVFVATSILESLYLVVMYCIFDDELQTALGNMKKDVKKKMKDRKQKKKEKKKLEEDDEPDWVKQSTTSHYMGQRGQYGQRDWYRQQYY